MELSAGFNIILAVRMMKVPSVLQTLPSVPGVMMTVPSVKTTELY